MKRSTHWSPARRLTLAVALLVVAGIAILPVAQAGTTVKIYTTTFTGSVGAGSLGTYTLTMKNTSGTQQLGSANVTVNSALVVKAGSATASPGTASISGNVVQVRNLSLQPAGTATVTFRAEATCLQGTYASTIVAKQANNFNGNPGNDFVQTPGNLDPGVVTTSVTGTCKLNFLSSSVTSPQVGDTQVSSAITDAPASSGGPVRVEVLDDSSTHRVVSAFGSASPITMSIGSNPGGGTLSGTLAKGASAGVASFGNLSIDKPGIGYTLFAEGKDANGTADSWIDPAGATSDQFNIDNVIFFCNKQNCGKQSAITNDNTITSQLDPTNELTQGNLLALALNVETIDCAGYDELTSTVTIEYTGTGTKVATDTIPAAVAGNRSASQFETCFGSPTQFTTKDGTLAVFNSSTGLYVGLLPGCDKTVSNVPCTFPGKKDPKTGDIIIKYVLPQGDPAGRH